MNSIQNQKTKILYIIDGLIVGGAQTFLIELVKNLDKEKFEIQVVTIIEKGVLATDLAQMGVAVDHIQKKGKLSLGLIFKLRKYIKEFSPQIVHTQLFGSDTWGRLAAFFAGVPVIISTEQNINPDEGKIKELVKMTLSWITNVIIVISQGVKEYAIKHDHLKSEKLHLIYNAIDLNKFKFRGCQPINKKQIKAGVVARFDKQKGHKYLLQAMPQIIKKYPGFQLILAGTGSLEQDLIAQVKELNIENNIEFIGVRHDIPSLLNTFDLFIMPSQWEGLGIAVIEAQAVGVPVLVSNVPGMSELVEQGKTGYLFESKNPQAIYEAIDKFLSEPQAHQNIIANARKQAEEKFGIEKMTEEYEKVYFEMLNIKF